jgi:arsenite oxidase large subunit
VGGLFAPDGLSRERLLQPRIVTGEGWRDTSWEDALALYAGLTRRVLDTEGPDGLLFNAFDHGGPAGGFENTWGTGKLMFSALESRMVRMVNRPGEDFECQASRDMGVRELNNAYEDAALADTLVSVGGNPGEAQAHYFLGHWVPNLRGDTLEWKEACLPGEPAAPGRVVFVDPARTRSVAMAEEAAGKARVLHLGITAETDAALFNALLTYVVDRGWHDRAFIAAHTTGFEETVRANRLSLEASARITGLATTALEQAARWMFEPKAGGARRRTMFGYSKGILWGRDPYRSLAALVDLGLATHNVGQRGTGVVHLGGHQEGYARPPPPAGGRPPRVDEALVHGRGRMLTVWGCNPLRTAPDSEVYREVLRRRSRVVREAMADARGASVEELADVIWDTLGHRGGLFVAAVDLFPLQSAQAAHLLLPAARPGEMTVTSMSGERRIRLSERFMDPPGAARPECLIAAAIANTLKRAYASEGDAAKAARFAGFDWKTEEDVFNDGFPAVHAAEFGGDAGRLVTYERLRALGTDGVQLPVMEYEGGKLIGTQRLYADGWFDTVDGRARFLPAPWSGPLPPPQMRNVGAPARERPA